RDRQPDRRASRGRPGGDGPGRPRDAPEPSPAAERAVADGARGAGRRGAAHAHHRRRPRPTAGPGGARLRGARGDHRRASAADRTVTSLTLLVSPMSATRERRSGRLSTMNCDRRTPDEILLVLAQRNIDAIDRE